MIEPGLAMERMVGCDREESRKITMEECALGCEVLMLQHADTMKSTKLKCWRATSGREKKWRAPPYCPKHLGT